jgi:dienelactone hydrolase
VVRARRRALLAAIALAVVATLAGAFGLNTLRAWLGWSAAAYAPADLAAQLRPGYVVTRPAGDGPFPTALLLSGCDGPKDNLTRLAERLAAAGWASVVVDSHGPRGLGEAEQWRLVCAGQLLTGSERAGDVAVALDDVRGMGFVDPERLALIGASHGGWAVLDLLALAAADEPPPILRAWPASLAERGLAGVRAAVLFYPYCGPLSLAAQTERLAPVPLLFLLVEGDRIAAETECTALAETRRAGGTPVEVEVFEGVTHGFDQADKAPLSALAYDPEATERAVTRTLDFLQARADMRAASAAPFASRRLVRTAAPAPRKALPTAGHRKTP